MAETLMLSGDQSFHLHHPDNRGRDPFFARSGVIFSLEGRGEVRHYLRHDSPLTMTTTFSSESAAEEKYILSDKFARELRESVGEESFEIADPSKTLASEPSVVVFLDTKAPDVVEKVLQDNGFARNPTSIIASPDEITASIQHIQQVSARLAAQPGIKLPL